MIFPPSIKVGIGFSLCQRDLYLPGQGPHVYSEEPLFYKCNFLIGLGEGWKKQRDCGPSAWCRCSLGKGATSLRHLKIVLDHEKWIWERGERSIHHGAPREAFRRGTPSPCNNKTQVVGRNLLLPISNLTHKCTELQQLKQMHFSKL